MRLSAVCNLTRSPVTHFGVLTLQPLHIESGSQCAENPRGRVQTLALKNVTHLAFQPFEKLLQRVDGDVLFAHFQTLKRGGGDAGAPLELCKCHVPTDVAQVVGKLFA